MDSVVLRHACRSLLSRSNFFRSTTPIATGPDYAADVTRVGMALRDRASLAALTEDELVDMVAYLETLKLAALTPDSFHIVGPFPAKDMYEALDHEYGPEKVASSLAAVKPISRAALAHVTIDSR